MKKFKLLSAIAMAGLLGLTARAAIPSGLQSVNVKLTILTQTNDTDTAHSEKFNVVKLKVTSKDVLGLIAKEFTNVDGITDSGSQLVVDDFFNGTFEVLDKDGNVILADASDSTNEDDYDLNYSYDNYVETGSESLSTDQETQDYTTVSEFDYDSATDTSWFEVDGAATVKFNTNANDKGTESYKFAGAGDAEVNSVEAVATCTASGSGKFND